VQKGRDFAVVQALDRELELRRSIWSGGHRVRTGGRVAIRRGQADQVVLTGEMG
jgi:hypothetical protein